MRMRISFLLNSLLNSFVKVSCVGRDRVSHTIASNAQGPSNYRACAPP